MTETQKLREALAALENANALSPCPMYLDGGNLLREVISGMAQSEPDERDKVALSIATDALDEIALAGMSGTGQESEEAMRDWHARQAWKFIGIAARAKSAIDAAIAAHAAAKGDV